MSGAKTFLRVVPDYVRPFTESTLDVSQVAWLAHRDLFLSRIARSFFS